MTSYSPVYTHFQGEGCALMGRTNRFEQIVRSMTSVMDVPLTVKIRTGIFEDKHIAHTLVPKLRDWGVSMVTVSKIHVFFKDESFSLEGSCLRTLGASYTQKLGPFHTYEFADVQVGFFWDRCMVVPVSRDTPAWLTGSTSILAHRLPTLFHCMVSW